MWFYKGGKCGCCVLINKRCSRVQSTLHAIRLCVQSGSNQFYAGNFHYRIRPSFVTVWGAKERRGHKAWCQRRKYFRLSLFREIAITANEVKTFKLKSFRLLRRGKTADQNGDNVSDGDIILALPAYIIVIKSISKIKGNKGKSRNESLTVLWSLDCFDSQRI